VRSDISNRSASSRLLRRPWACSNISDESSRVDFMDLISLSFPDQFLF